MTTEQVTSRDTASTTTPSRTQITIFWVSRDKHTRKHKHTDTQTHSKKRTHFYSRRWSWPSFHGDGSSDPALWRQARHCGPGQPRPFSSRSRTCLVAPNHRRSRSFSASSCPRSLSTSSESLLWKCTKHFQLLFRKLSLKTREFASVTGNPLSK